MERIKDAIQEIMRSWETRIKPGANAVEPPDVLLKKLLTKKEFGHIKFRYLRKGVLGIATDSSPWLYHFSLRKEELLEKLRKHIDTLKDIRFYIGEIR